MNVNLARWHGGKVQNQESRITIPSGKRIVAMIVFGEKTKARHQSIEERLSQAPQNNQVAMIPDKFCKDVHPRPKGHCRARTAE